ncbi:MAG: tetratricopeptide repeat protein [Opitutaceae bacterium]|nr:tetratricopeptide repeat protein [Opitutaceae bacterium]
MEPAGGPPAPRHDFGVASVAVRGGNAGYLAMARPNVPTHAPDPVAVRREFRDTWMALSLFAATFLAYLPALKADFIWNDSDYVTAPALRSPAGLGRIWFELGATEQYYPVLHSAFWLEHRLWGDSPAGYHVINILLHATAACLLAAIVRTLLNGPESASARPAAGQVTPLPAIGRMERYRGTEWLAAFVFALHPVGVESVAWISEQKNTLSLVYYLMAALLYLRFDDSRRHGTYLGATALFVLALFSKSTTATLPPALLVVFWWQRGRIDWRRDVMPLLPWFILGAAMGLLSAYVEREYIGAKGSEFALDGVQRTLLAGRIAWFYVGKLVWPGELIFIYPRWTIDPSDPLQWLFPIAAVGGVVVLWALRRRSRAPLAATLFFGGSLFPVLGFFNVYAFLFSFVADHWQYLPSIGLVVFGAAGLTRLLAERPPVVRRGIPALLVATLGLLSFHQSRMYADIRTFYRTTLDRNPGAWMAHNNLGNLLREDGRHEEAVAHLEAALRVRPDLVKVHNNLANCLRDLKRPREALTHYQRALEFDANYVEALNNAGRLLREMGQKEAALEYLLRAVRLDPDYPDARNNLGMVLRDIGRMPEAVVQFERAIKADPSSAPAHLNLALCLSLVGRDEEAMEHYQAARRLNPKIPELPLR